MVFFNSALAINWKFEVFLSIHVSLLFSTKPIWCAFMNSISDSGLNYILTLLHRETVLKLMITILVIIITTSLRKVLGHALDLVQ